MNAHGVIGKTGGEYAPVAVFTEDWVRNKAWVNLPITSSDEKIIGLHAVDKESNHCAFTASGDYTVDWGDGVTSNMLAVVESYIAGISDQIARKEAEIEFSAPDWESDNPLLLQMWAGLLGGNQESLNQAFQQALLL